MCLSVLNLDKMSTEWQILLVFFKVNERVRPNMPGGYLEIFNRVVLAENIAV